MGRCEYFRAIHSWRPRTHPFFFSPSSTIRIALENTSTSPVDFVKLTFSDMHTTSTEAYVAENELAPGDAYEIESENLHRPVFSWASTEFPLIAPGASTVLEVKCLGKVGW